MPAKKSDKTESKEQTIKLVKMAHVDSGKEADVHPDEVENWKSCGYKEI
jgi:hypothetical protein